MSLFIKIYVGSLLLLVLEPARGDDHHHYDSFGSHSFGEPWYAFHDFLDMDHHHHHHRAESSQLVPQYAGSPYHHDPILPSSSNGGFKKIYPSEDKNSKKPISPLYNPTDMNSPKFKEVFKSGSPLCREISAKESTTRMNPVHTGDPKVTCYRCKDPIYGSTFEQCSYTSQKPRTSRSNALERSADSLTAASDPRGTKKTKKTKRPQESDEADNAYRFGVDYFQPETRSPRSREAETTAATDGCERITRNSMVCMVCRDPKTNGKYEQCSYVAQPNEKARGYYKSSSFGNPGNKAKASKPLEKSATVARAAQKLKLPAEPSAEQEEEEEPEKLEEASHEPEYYKHDESEDASDYHHPGGGDDDNSEDKEGHYTYNFPSYHDTYSGGGGSGAESYELDDDSKQDAKASEGSCKTVHRDGQSCKVCTNPKTGGESERCEYAHEPKDKVYKYSKSNSFGYPESQSNDDDGEASSSASGSSEKLQQDDGGSGEDYYGGLDHVRSESEKISKQRAKDAGNDDCRKVKRDSMVCTICKDRKTGEESENCNYSYDPDDKVYAYTKSKSFGGPTKYSEEEQPEESVIYPTGTSPLDYIPKTSESRVHATKEQKPKGKKVSKVDNGFDDARTRRDEIEKIVKDMDTEDRSKCKKVRRGDMTCYRCTDGKGSTNEECVFVADPEPDEQPAGTTVTTTTTTDKPSFKPKHRRTRAARNKDDGSGEDDPDDTADEEETHEAEPYDYVAETRPVYDKVLGLTLPAYMLQKSPHEIEFDKFVENSHNS